MFEYRKLRALIRLANSLNTVAGLISRCASRPRKTHVHQTCGNTDSRLFSGIGSGVREAPT